MPCNQIHDFINQNHRIVVLVFGEFIVKVAFFGNLYSVNILDKTVFILLRYLKIILAFLFQDILYSAVQGCVENFSEKLFFLTTGCQQEIHELALGNYCYLSEMVPIKSKKLPDIICYISVPIDDDFVIQFQGGICVFLSGSTAHFLCSYVTWISSYHIFLSFVQKRKLHVGLGGAGGKIAP